MLSRLCYRSRGSFGLRACSPPCPNSPGLTSRPANPGPLPRVYPMNSRCARNHGGPPRVYKERSGPPTFPRRGNVGVGFAGVVGGPNPACGPHAKKSSRPQPQKNRPRRGRSGIKEGLFRRTAFCLKESKKFRLRKNAHPGLWGYEGSTNLHRGRETKVVRTPGPPLNRTK